MKLVGHKYIQRTQCSTILNTSTSFTEKSGECDKHSLLKVSELELEPVKLQREMQKRKLRLRRKLTMTQILVVNAVNRGERERERDYRSPSR